MALELLQDSMKYPKSNENEEERLTSWLDSVQNVREACDIALGILNQLLTFDKLSSNMLKLERKLVPVMDIVNGNVKLFRLQAMQSGISFHIELNKDERSFLEQIVVYVDEHKINQVFRNLLSNAMKFTPRKGAVMVKVVLGVDDEKQKHLNADKFKT